VPDEEPSESQRVSSFRVEITLSVGYDRKRSTLGGAFEGHAVTLMLLIGGTVLVFLVVDLIFRLLQIHVFTNAAGS
jgi:hypothetical protein